MNARLVSLVGCSRVPAHVAAEELCARRCAEHLAHTVSFTLRKGLRDGPSMLAVLAAQVLRRATQPQDFNGKHPRTCAVNRRTILTGLG